MTRPNSTCTPVPPAKAKTSRLGGTPKLARDSRKRSASSVPNISPAELLELGATQTKEHLHSKNTTGKYNGYIKRGRDMLVSICDGRDQGGAGDPDPLAELLLEDEDDMLMDDEPSLNDPELCNAFSGRPSEYTPLAIALILTWECIHQSKGLSTAQGIHAAWIKEYDQL